MNTVCWFPTYSCFFQLHPFLSQTIGPNRAPGPMLLFRTLHRGALQPRRDGGSTASCPPSRRLSPGASREGGRREPDGTRLCGCLFLQQRMVVRIGFVLEQDLQECSIPTCTLQRCSFSMFLSETKKNGLSYISGFFRKHIF